MSERFKINELNIDETTPISEIQPISEGGVEIQTREDLEKLVEPPLLEACQVLFDKRIRTIFSSANKYDISSGEGYITIDFDNLSPKNREIAKSIGGETHMTHGSEPVNAINLPIPISNDSTVGEINKASLEIVSKFENQ